MLGVILLLGSGPLAFESVLLCPFSTLKAIEKFPDELGTIESKVGGGCCTWWDIGENMKHEGDDESNKI